MTRESRADGVFDRLGLAIASGDPAPGTTLPTEAELAQNFGVGRSSVREALRGLSGLGMIRAAPRRGTVVTERHEWNGLSRDLLRWSIAGGTHAAESLAAIDEARRVFEPESAALVASRASRMQILAIEAAYARMEDAAARGAPEEVVLADREFHLSILRATGNPILEAFNAAISEVLGLLFDATANHMDNFRANLPNHLAVVEAIRQGDPEAARAAMLATIGFTSQRMRDSGLIRS